MQVYELAGSDRRYDLVLFLGVFYHLRYPLLGLDIVSQKVGRLLAFQTMTLPGDEVAEVPVDGHVLDRDPMLQRFVQSSFRLIGQHHCPARRSRHRYLAVVRDDQDDADADS